MMRSSLEIVGVPILSDNYVWLMHDADSGETVAVDPGEAAPVLAAAADRGWTIDQIWTTHWHPDHTGGNAAIKVAAEAWGGCTISGPVAEAAKIPTLDVLVAEDDVVRIGSRFAEVLDTPAHTAGHIAFYLPDERIAFVGDTLFPMGCGRLFEGTAAQMFDAMARFARLPEDTLVYAAHEYTASNGRYARVAEPDNADIGARMVEVDRLRAGGEPTLPTTIALELATNPFMRAGNVDELARHRAAKDVFKG